MDLNKESYYIILIKPDFDNFSRKVEISGVI